MAKPRAKKIIKILLVVLAVIVVVVLIGGYIFYRDLTRGPLPQHNGELQIAGLKDKVEILRDEWGVPQIYASNMHDLFFAQGYTQAQDRWWQMEWWRHIADGRIGEIAGKDNDILEIDAYFRSLGFRQIAEQEVELLDPETKAYLQAFADGVNAYIMSRNSGDLAVEYGVLRLLGKRVKVEPWTPADTLACAKLEAYSQNPARNMENVRAQLYELFGQEMTEEWLTPPWPFGEKPTIIQPEDLGTTGSTVTASYKAGSDAGIVDGHTLASRDALPDMSLVFDVGASIGCNVWVVSGNMTESGMPLLANDQWLSPDAPSGYLRIGLHCPATTGQEPFDVTGFAGAVIPGIVYGHNSFIAWGSTGNAETHSIIHTGRVDLIIMPPVDFMQLARLNSSLHKLADLRILSTEGIIDGGTSISVEVKRPIHLVAHLKQLDVVEEAVAEDLLDSHPMRDSLGKVSALRPLKYDANEKRILVILKMR